MSALESSDSHHGIFVPPDTPSPVKLPSEPNLYLRPRMPDHYEVFRSAILNQRAWTLQKRLLSTRIIHYSSKELFWECLSCTARQGSAIEFTGKLDKGAVVTSEGEDFKRVLTYLATEENSNASHDIPSIWYRLLTQYSRRQLSRVSDRLPAISGLASKIHDATNGTYLAGIWKEDLQHLLWFLDQDLYHKQGHENQLSKLSAEEYGYQAPSWSWASIPRPVYYSWRADEMPVVDLERDAHYLDSDINPAGEDAFGAVWGGNIVLRAYALPLQCECKMLAAAGMETSIDYNHNRLSLEVPQLRMPAFHRSRRREPNWFGIGHFDDNIGNIFGINSFIPDCTICTAAWIGARSSNIARSFLYCLLLQKVTPDGDTWRRIGIARIGAESEYPSDIGETYWTIWNWQEQDLKII